MKLNHINLPTDDLVATKAFFERYFDFTCTDVKGDNALAVLKGEDDFILVLMSRAFVKNVPVSYPEAFHIGFLMKSEQRVDHAYQRLLTGGTELENPPGRRRGQYGFYLKAPGNLLIEVSSY